jgi:hypothetical protein
MQKAKTASSNSHSSEIRWQRKHARLPTSPPSSPGRAQSLGGLVTDVPLTFCVSVA